LHHLADPIAGWRVLLGLLRPGGFMHVGLYSELARRDIVAARAFILEQGYRPTADDIRRCRQDLLNSPLSGVAKASDFFSTSECRDLLFHIQERRLTIPQIKSFIRPPGDAALSGDFRRRPFRARSRSLARVRDRKAGHVRRHVSVLDPEKLKACA